LATQLRLDQFSRFEVRTCPGPNALGRALEGNWQSPGAVLQLRFGEQVAGLPISDVWSACCELLLQAQLVREGRLDHFVLDVEQVFELTYADELIFCIFSPEHVFAVSREGFAASVEQLVEEIFAATSCARLMHVAARWGAFAIRGLPYSARFSDSELT
jgi:hypothetical protein